MTRGLSIGPALGLASSAPGAATDAAPGNALRLNGQPVTLNGHFITLSKAV